MYLNTTILNEYYTNLLSYNYTIFFSIVAITFAISVITSKNPIFSVLFLIGLFLIISLYLISLGLKFMGIAYLLVYVGAISILFLFILMLINIRVSELLTERNNSVLLAIVTLFLLNSSIDYIIPYNSYIINIFSDYTFNIKYINYDLLSNKLFLSLSDMTNGLETYESVATMYWYWDSALIESSHITTVGTILYSNLFIFIILISMILLLAMVGSIIVTIKK